MQKILQKSRYTLGAVALIAVAIALRLVLLLEGWPPTNSDESTMNLMALHIMDKGEHPIFFYGQHYLGPLEAYAGALMFRIFGVSVLSMRIGALLFYGGFLICMYFITSRVFNKPLALITVGLLAAGSSWVIAYQLFTTGYTPLPCLCALLFLLSYQLVSSQGAWYRRAILYLLWGLIAGLAIWAQLIVVPYVLFSGLLLLVEWRPLLKYGFWFALIGLLIGAFPLIYYNLHAPPGVNSFNIFLHTSQLGANQHYSLKDYIYSSLFISLPSSLGLGPTCYIPHVPLTPIVYPHTEACLITQEVYGLGYVLVLIAAGIMASAALIISKRESMRQESIQQWARLMLILAAALTLIVFTHSPTSVFTGIIGVRYLICLLVSLPVFLWGIWQGLGYMRKFLPQQWEWLTMVARLGVISILFFVSIDGTVHTFEGIPIVQAGQQNVVQLANELESQHVTRFYTDYWTCNRLIFQTREQLICATTQGNLEHDTDRYPAYRTMVEATPNPGFVLANNSVLLTKLEDVLRATHTPYQRFDIVGYAIILPAYRIPGLNLYEG